MVHTENRVSKKAKTSYNLEWREYVNTLIETDKLQARKLLILCSTKFWIGTWRKQTSAAYGYNNQKYLIYSLSDQQALTVVDEVFVCIRFLFVLSLICNSSFHGRTFVLISFENFTTLSLPKRMNHYLKQTSSFFVTINLNPQKVVQVSSNFINGNHQSNF